MSQTVRFSRELAQKIVKYMKENNLETESITTGARVLINIGLKEEEKRRNNIG